MATKSKNFFLSFSQVPLKVLNFNLLRIVFILKHFVHFPALNFNDFRKTFSSSGLPGQNGFIGPRGMDGKKGDRGSKGDQGPMGLPGPMGFRGDSGNTGAVGKPGYPVSPEQL